MSQRLKVWQLLVLCALTCGCALAQQPNGTAKLPQFAVASIRPSDSASTFFSLRFTSDGVSIENASLLMIVRAAYGMFNSLDDKFIGMPGWAKSQRYNIEAKVDAADAPAFQRLDFDHRQLMVQAMLKERFDLQAHEETREQPVYFLSIAKNGPKLQETKSAEGADPGGTLKRTRGQIVGQNIVVSQLVSALTQTLGRTVVDKTEHLGGKYDITLNWTPDDVASAGPDGAAQSPEAEGPSIFTAVQEQLGLKLDSGKAPVECLVIDHIGRPSAN